MANIRRDPRGDSGPSQAPSEAPSEEYVKWHDAPLGGGNNSSGNFGGQIMHTSNDIMQPAYGSTLLNLGSQGHQEESEKNDGKSGDETKKVDHSWSGTYRDRPVLKGQGSNGSYELY